MTTTSPAPAPATLRPGSARRVLRALAIASCVPYVSLKLAWISGSRVGIPEGSILLDDPGLMAALNLVTVAMDAAVVVLALLFTQRWGLAVRAWLLVLPMWVATGLLAPIMVGYPVQLAVAGPPAPAEPFLDTWVFAVVYGGFIVQGLTLGTLFALYARDRWSRVWRGRVGDLSPSPAPPAVRVAAVAASALLAAPAVVHALWLSGSTVGLPDGRTAATGDLSALEGVRLLFLAAAAAGVPALVLRLGRALPVKAPLALAWTGSAGVCAWGGWLLLAGLLPQADPADEPTALMTLTYAGEMITGLVLGACVAVVLRRRAA
ncbi:hypothetical protein [Streptomyces ficellus]|uniref:Aromatic ring-opening dioxygenase LigA n=1 Tax=Streptomyces ficellus TaxID=1977088 RepID=A0A6I6FDK7_9ACTN|nr:hypothetical protein [Streptomyces ficellus]QGV81264.1 hypothetical protein EIZ62_25725 [Streptomyces ficellus]